MESNIERVLLSKVKGGMCGIFVGLPMRCQHQCRL